MALGPRFPELPQRYVRSAVVTLTRAANLGGGEGEEEDDEYEDDAELLDAAAAGGWNTLMRDLHTYPLELQRVIVCLARAARSRSSSC